MTVVTCTAFTAMSRPEKASLFFLCNIAMQQNNHNNNNNKSINLPKTSNKTVNPHNQPCQKIETATRNKRATNYCRYLLLLLHLLLQLMNLQQSSRSDCHDYNGGKNDLLLPKANTINSDESVLTETLRAKSSLAIGHHQQHIK